MAGSGVAYKICTSAYKFFFNMATNIDWQNTHTGMLKKDVGSELPDKVEKVINVRMSALQSQLYKQMRKYNKMSAAGQG